MAEMGIDGVKIHLLYVVKGTPLERLHARGAYTCMTQKEYVMAVCDFLERVPETMVIQRLTGDAHRDELVEPRWSLKKQETRNLILKTLEERGTKQGSRCK